jgi:hypothetical protein
VAIRLRDRYGVVWPPHDGKPRMSKLDPIPGPEDYTDAILVEVCPLVPGIGSIDLRVAHPGKRPVPTAIDLLDVSLRERLFHFLKNHKGKTITELGNLDVDF